MATTSSFKQQCPSCEAMVPIRDPGLVGKKIDCPKCKYRFLVEEPVPEETEDEELEQPKSTAVTNKKGKGKLRDESVPADEDEEGKGESKGKNNKVLYIGIGLGVVALVALVGGGILLFGGGSKPAAGGGGAPVASPAKPAAAATVVEAPRAAAAPVTVEVETGPIDDLSNLLPNETSTIVSWGIDKLRDSSAKNCLLETSGAFSEATFERTFGFPLENVKELITAVLPTDKPEQAAFFSLMRVQKPYDKDHLVKSLKLVQQEPINGFAEVYTVDGDLDTLGALFLRLSSPSTEKFSVHLFGDERTLLFADAAPFKKFLEDKRRPRQMTQPPPSAPDPSTIREPAAASAPPQPAGGPKGGGRPINPKVGKNAAPDLPEYSVKTLFQGPGGIGDVAGRRRPMGDQAAEAEPNASNSYMTIDPNLKVVMDRLDHDKIPSIIVIASLTTAGKVLPAEITSAGALNRDDLDNLLPKLYLPDGAQVVAVAVHEFTETKVSGMVVLQAETDEMAARAKLALESLWEQAAELLRTFWEMDVKVGGQAGNGPAARPNFTPRIGGVAPPPAGVVGQPVAGTGKDGNIASWQRGRTVALSIDLNISHKLYEVIRDGLKAEAVQLKGLAELVASRLRVHELARALQLYVKEKGTFPRGALQRAPSAERGIDWYPDQRLSWMVELLPYLGDGEYKDLTIDPDKSWNEGSNLLAAQVLVPQFLSPGDPKSAHVHYPGRIGSFAATRFVGVAGLGLDAATYPAGDPALVKKLGVFGYNRVTKQEDIRDDPESTIAMLQVPSGQIMPWLAGGGSTLRGISEGDDALKPFICVDYKGKKGTFAVMCDGKVRFIPEDMKPATFRALCTIAGGERTDDINQIAPLVPEEAATELKTAPLASAAPAPPASAPAAPEAKAPSAPAAPAQPAAGQAGLPAGWKEIVDEAAGYAIAVPPGQVAEVKLPAVAGITTITKAVVRADGKGGCALSYMKLPTQLPASELTKFAAGIRSTVFNTAAGAKFERETAIQLDGYPGFEWVGQTPQAGKLILRSYVVKDRCYQIGVNGADKFDPKEIEAFFGSFRLLKK
jgi:Protein of unknown function (DUF1559)